MGDVLSFLSRELTLDTKPARLLLDIEPFCAEEIARQLRSRLVTLVIPEIAAVQVFEYGDTDRCFRRFRNLARLAAQPGRVIWLGAGLDRFFTRELASVEIKRSPLYEERYVATMFKNGDTRKLFARWHADHRRESKWLDSAGFLDRDREAHRLAIESFGYLNDPSTRKAALRAWLAQVPRRLRSNFILEGLVPNPKQREYVCANQRQCRSIVSLSLSGLANVVGAATDPKDFSEYKHLRIASDSWNDARILAASVYSDALVTDDKPLTERAEMIRRWGPFAPDVLSFSAALGFLLPVLTRASSSD